MHQMAHLVSNFEYLLLLCFLTLAEFWNLGHLQSTLGNLNSKEIILSKLDFFPEKNQNKHSKYNTKFVIRRPVEMTYVKINWVFWQT